MANRNRAPRARRPSAPQPDTSGLVAVVPLEGAFINGLPHIPQLAEPAMAEKYVASGAFRYATDEERELLDEVSLDPDVDFELGSHEPPAHFSDESTEGEDETDVEPETSELEPSTE